jgi:hypothetical protein
MVFKQLGYRLVDRHEKMSELQIDTTTQSTTFKTFFDALNVNPELASQLASEFDREWSADFQKFIDGKIAEKNKPQPEPVQVQPVAQPQPIEAPATAPAEATTQKAIELRRYERKALKHVGEMVDFYSDILEPETISYLANGLPKCATADEVKALFVGVESEKIIPMPQDGLFRLAAVIDAATKKLDEPEVKSYPMQMSQPMTIVDNSGVIQESINRYEAGVKQEIIQYQSSMEADVKDLEEVLRKLTDGMTMMMENANKPVIVQPQINVAVPEQKPPDVIVNEREQPAPVVNVEQAHPAPVKPMEIVFIRDRAGKITGAKRV